MIIRLTALLLLTPLLAAAQSRDTTKTPQRAKPSPEVRADALATDPLVLQNQLLSLSNVNTQIRLVDNRYEGLRGTPYLVPNWSKGEIELLGGKVYTNVSVKFNASTQNLVMLRPTPGDSIIIFAGQIKRFAFLDGDGNAFLYRRYPDLKTDDAALKESYFQVLYPGKNTLLKRTSKSLRKADYQQAYSANIRYDSYQDEVTYYLLRPDQSLIKLKRARKPLFEAIGGDENALKAFSEREKLSFKTDTDMARLVQFADNL